MVTSKHCWSVICLWPHWYFPRRGGHYLSPDHFSYPPWCASLQSHPFPLLPEWFCWSSHLTTMLTHTHTHTHTGPLQVEDCVLSSLGFLLLVFSNLMPRMGLKSMKISILAFWHFPRQPAQTLAHSERSVQKCRRKEGRLEFNCICSCPLSWWCHSTISSSVVPFSSHLQSFPASGSFQISQFLASGGQSIGISASVSLVPMNIQDWFPLGLTGWNFLQSKGLWRVFSNTTVQKHQFFSAQFSL